MQKSEDKIELIEWNRWFNKFVDPIFQSADRDEYYDLLKKMQAPFYPRYWIAEKFYQTIQNDLRFDDQLKKFFSFLYSCGFFMENIIEFENWLTIPNWWQPQSKDKDEKSILEILKEPNGSDLLKSKIRWLPFLSRPDGN